MTARRGYRGDVGTLQALARWLRRGGWRVQVESPVTGGRLVVSQRADRRAVVVFELGADGWVACVGADRPRVALAYRFQVADLLGER